MKLHRLALAILAAAALGLRPAAALDRPEITFKVFQFPPDKIPRVDGDPSDWDIVPQSYVIDGSQLTDVEEPHTHPDPKVCDVKVKVGWVKGLNRLYFLLVETKPKWDFAGPGLQNDTFEVVVDGDASGGPLIDKSHREFWTPEHVGVSRAVPDDRISNSEAHWAIQGVQAQNYHIFTPAKDKDWCMAWDAATWIKELPWANAATKYDFQPGQGGTLVEEFWITPFDYAGPEGPQRAVPSVLYDNKIIGLCFAVFEYDPTHTHPSNHTHFWDLSPHFMMYGDASEACAFRLMPLEPQFLPPIGAQWSWKVVDMDRRVVAFKDLSVGQITSWKWDFGDGTTSTEQYPIHQYKEPGSFVVVLTVQGPAGTAHHSKVWDVQLK
jgi:hypothetical protein